MSKMLNLKHNLLLRTLVLSSLIWICVSIVIQAGETPSVEGTKVYFINLEEGQTVKSPFLVQFGLTSEMGIAPALADWPDTGHHHLIIDAATPNPNKAISNKHLHLSLGQTEIFVKLPAGKHTLQAVFGDYSHVPHDPPVMSKVINIIVE
ncbi:MAG TPA: rod shape-determining protein RodA [Deltaproteobacteria bacterium]|nr:rod shape-determining protein RodA [Deltaproteobacteria bacterium]|tara:strand:- start:1366 stop:1815 length:450 start_codon:yes stop_codon:yes gene_type:complete